MPGLKYADEYVATSMLTSVCIIETVTNGDIMTFSGIILKIQSR